jgi:hypothetical protein
MIGGINRIAFAAIPTDAVKAAHEITALFLVHDLATFLQHDTFSSNSVAQNRDHRIAGLLLATTFLY